MAKKKETEKKPERIIVQNITDVLELNYMPYTMSVIVSRAIPEIDGFKPSHRKLLYTMYKMGLLTGGKVKSADIVGQTMRLNPHGDGAIYETMVRLTRGNEALLHPFIDSKGNFGKQYSRDMAYAASRYTEAKLDNFCQEIFKDIDKNTVDFIDNYSSTMQEPVLLPTTFPNVLVNSNQGIAVGMASNICSFNLREVCSATIAYIKNNNTDLSEYLKAPDFSTGAQIIYDKEKLTEIYETGRGSVKLRAKYHFDEKNSCIEVTEIPYTTNVEVIIDKVIALIKLNKIREITDIRDETDLNGMRIAIDVRRGTKPDILMHKLYTMTPLEDTFSCNFNILINGKPKTMGIKTILAEWLLFREGCMKRQIGFDLEKKTAKLHLLEGLSKILLDIDKAIRIIRGTEEEEMVIPNLMAGFQIDEVQADFIAEIKLRNLNKAYILKRTDEISQIKNEIDDLRDILAKPERIQQIIIADLKEIAKKYGKDRKTEIILPDDVLEVSHDELIEDYEIKLILTEHMYFKKISALSLRFSGEQKLKEDDRIFMEIDTTNKADILLFTNQRTAYKLHAYEIADSKASVLGDFLPNTLQLAEGEKIIYMACTKDYSGFFVFAYDSGKVSKVPVSQYATKNNRKKLLNAYGDKGEVILISHTAADQDILLVRSADKATLFNTALVPLSQSRSVSGIQVYTLRKNSSVTHAYLAENFDCPDIEHYRAKKIPSNGHFISAVEKVLNNI